MSKRVGKMTMLKERFAKAEKPTETQTELHGAIYIVFFSAPFCHCKLKRVQVPVPTAAYAASHASRTGREAAGLRSLLPASVCQELVQSWRRASSSKLRLEG